MAHSVKYLKISDMHIEVVFASCNYMDIHYSNLTTGKHCKPCMKPCMFHTRQKLFQTRRTVRRVLHSVYRLRLTMFQHRGCKQSIIQRHPRRQEITTGHVGCLQAQCSLSRVPAQTHVLLISRGGSLAVSLCEAYSLQISRERVCKPCTLFKYDIDKIGSCASKKIITKREP